MGRAGIADRCGVCCQPRPTDALSVALGRAVLGFDRGKLGCRPSAGSPIGAAPSARLAAPGGMVGGTLRRPRHRVRAAFPAAAGNGVVGQSARRLYVRAGAGAVPDGRGGIRAGNPRFGSTPLGWFQSAGRRRSTGHAKRHGRLFRAVPPDRDAGAASLVRRVAEPRFSDVSAARNMASGASSPSALRPV